MAQKAEQNDSADPGGFHELSKRPAQTPGDKLSAFEQEVVPDLAAEGEPATDDGDVSDEPVTGSQR